MGTEKLRRGCGKAARYLGGRQKPGAFAPRLEDFGSPGLPAGAGASLLKAAAP
jgi:hypothetical protein